MSDEDDLFAQLEDVFQEVLDETHDDFSTWSLPDLLDELHETTDQLAKANELLYPRSQRTRDLHSRRNAVQLALEKKGWRE